MPDIYSRGQKPYRRTYPNTITILNSKLQIIGLFELGNTVAERAPDLKDALLQALLLAARWASGSKYAASVTSHWERLSKRRMDRMSPGIAVLVSTVAPEIYHR
jgi:hypothetical protein